MAIERIMMSIKEVKRRLQDIFKFHRLFSRRIAKSSMGVSEYLRHDALKAVSTIKVSTDINDLIWISAVFFLLLSKYYLKLFRIREPICTGGKKKYKTNRDSIEYWLVTTTSNSGTANIFIPPWGVALS